MAYRRRQGLTRTSTLKQEIHYPDDDSSSSPSSSSSLAAQAIRASAAHRESSLSSAYGDSAFSYASRDSVPQRSPSRKVIFPHFLIVFCFFFFFGGCWFESFKWELSYYVFVPEDWLVHQSSNVYSICVFIYWMPIGIYCTDTLYLTRHI